MYLELDPETAAERAGADNKFERAGFLSAVASNYRRLREAEPERFVEVDATAAPEAVIERVEQLVTELSGRTPGR